MASTFREWDRDVVPHLQRIEQAAEQILYWSDQIENASLILKAMPEFETKAEAMMDLAVKKIQQAKKELKNKRPGE